MSDKRREFLEIFLVTFQDGKVEVTAKSDDVIEARIMWSDDDEWQFFRWPMTEQALPDVECLTIAKFLKSKGLIAIDRIDVSREQLFDMMNKQANVTWTFERFEKLLEELLSVDVPISEDGKQVGALWIHE